MTNAAAPSISLLFVDFVSGRANISVVQSAVVIFDRSFPLRLSTLLARPGLIVVDLWVICCGLGAHPSGRLSRASDVVALYVAFMAGLFHYAGIVNMVVSGGE